MPAGPGQYIDMPAVLALGLDPAFVDPKAMGGFSGFCRGRTALGVTVMPLVPYLNSIGLQRESLIQAYSVIRATAQWVHV